MPSLPKETRIKNGLLTRLQKALRDAEAGNVEPADACRGEGELVTENVGGPDFFPVLQAPCERTVETLRDYMVNLRRQVPQLDLDLAIQAGDCELALSIITSDTVRKTVGSQKVVDRPCVNRIQRYARAQRLYSQDPARLVEEILASDNGELTGEASDPPAEEDVRRVFEELFSAEACEDRAWYAAPASVIGDEQLLYPISPEEIEGKRKTMSGAHGTDGITVEALKRIPSVMLSKLFNLVIYTKQFPASWKKCRTVLIPKADSDSSQAVNNRPITIQSVFVRLLNRILAKRLSSVLNLSDKQFCGAGTDGCWMACTTLDAVIRTARTEKRELNVAFLDVAKAFDSVHHSSIIRGLRRAGIGEGFVSYVTNLYDGVTTDICWSGHRIEEISMTRSQTRRSPQWIAFQPGP